MVLQERIELSTSPLPRECSTTELLQRPGARSPERAGLVPQPRAHGKPMNRVRTGRAMAQPSRQAARGGHGRQGGRARRDGLFRAVDRGRSRIAAPSAMIPYDFRRRLPSANRARPSRQDRQASRRRRASFAQRLGDPSDHRRRPRDGLRGTDRPGTPSSATAPQAHAPQTQAPQAPRRAEGARAADVPPRLRRTPRPAGRRPRQGLRNGAMPVPRQSRGRAISTRAPDRLIEPNPGRTAPSRGESAP